MGGVGGGRGRGGGWGGGGIPSKVKAGRRVPTTVDTVTSDETSDGPSVARHCRELTDVHATEPHTTESTRPLGVASDTPKLRPWIDSVPISVRAEFETPR